MLTNQQRPITNQNVTPYSVTGFSQERPWNEFQGTTWANPGLEWQYSQFPRTTNQFQTGRYASSFNTDVTSWPTPYQHPGWVQSQWTVPQQTRPFDVRNSNFANQHVDQLRQHLSHISQISNQLSQLEDNSKVRLNEMYHFDNEMRRHIDQIGQQQVQTFDQLSQMQQFTNQMANEMMRLVSQLDGDVQSIQRSGPQVDTSQVVREISDIKQQIENFTQHLNRINQVTNQLAHIEENNQKQINELAQIEQEHRRRLDESGQKETQATQALQQIRQISDAANFNCTEIANQVGVLMN